MGHNRPPSDGHFRLIDLPRELTLKIFRFLDSLSIRKMILTSTTMFEFVERNKRFLVYRKFPVVRIERSRTKNITVYTTTVYKEYFYQAISLIAGGDKRLLDYHRDVRTMRDSEAQSTPFFQMFAEKFGNAKIKRLEIHDFCLDREHLDQLENVMTKKRVEVECMQIKDVEFTFQKDNGASFLKFLLLFKPKKLVLHETNEASLRKMFSSDFINLLPRLDSLSINNSPIVRSDWVPLIIDFKPKTEKIPREMVVEIALVTHIDLVRSGIHGWWNDKIDICRWWVTLDQGWDLYRIAQVIGLPTTDPNNVRLKYHSPNRNEQTALRVVFYPGGRWTIDAFPLNPTHRLY